MKTNKKYGTYYNILKEYNENISFGDYYGKALSELVVNLLNIEVLEILFDCNDNYADTMFIKTDYTTDYKELMKIIVKLRPNEFSEESPNHFRIWFD